MPPILIDTNILVYLYDRRDLLRQGAAVRLIGILARTGIGRLSVQCLSEFYSAVTRQKRHTTPVLSVHDAINETQKLARSFPVYPLTVPVVSEALRGVQQHHLQFWDAQIWASARLNQIPTIFSEDVPSGEILEGVRYVNPLKSEFDPREWVQA
jgi:predicted nucleic acid-binding protein